MTDDKNKKNHQKDDQDMIKLIENLNRKDDVHLNRRAFLKASFGAIVAISLATTPFGVFSFMPDANGEVKRMEIADTKELAIGESKNFAYPTEDDRPSLYGLLMISMSPITTNAHISNVQYFMSIRRMFYYAHAIKVTLMLITAIQLQDLHSVNFPKSC